MTKVSLFKKVAIVVIVSCICAACACIPAYAYYYTHTQEHVEASNKGVIEVVCTLDESAVGGGVHTGIVFVAEGATAADAIDEAVVGSVAANNPEAIKNHSAESVRAYLADKTYTVGVYDAATQKPGTQTTYDSQSVGGESIKLDRFDNVVVVVS